MAIRTIRLEGDPLLRKRSREVEKIDDRILTLLDDMEQTMRKAEGVGLAAPQIGVLRRITVIDVGDGLIEMINPTITEMDGTQDSLEGCLSVPNKAGLVKRPQSLIVQFKDRNGEEQVLKAEGFLATAVCHEIDHLDGILYIDKAESMYNRDEIDEVKEEVE